MIFDMGTKTYTPVAWVLMTGKTEECYWQAFNWLTSIADIVASYIGVDFERAFFTQVAIHFPEAKLIGCLFHFKQAVRRKMIEMGIPENEVKFAMRRGVVDLITVIAKDELHKGIAFIRTMIIDLFMDLYDNSEESDKEQTDSSLRWDQFWEVYFIP